MSKRTQLNVRLPDSLYQAFQNKITKEGWQKSRLIAKWIEAFVKVPDTSSHQKKASSTNPVFPFDGEETEKPLYPATLMNLNEQIQVLVQEVKKLESQILLQQKLLQALTNQKMLSSLSLEQRKRQVVHTNS